MSTIAESPALFELFKLRAEAVSAQVQRVATKELALELIVRLLHQEGVDDQPHCYAVWAAGPMLNRSAQEKMERDVPGLKFTVTRELAADAKVGISQLEWALANTGTLVQTADAVDTRLVSTLPLLHIAIIPTASLLPDIPAVLRHIDPRKSSYLSFITGPSRTADIERVLTIGVHGPERLIIVMVDDLEVAA
ncbi:MAG TPA: lactate utilization protein [Candidatus Saccharimonadales bacterium]|nr:lactate utilization protein [Candidatus Saccharimonadales bacterium]